MFEQLKKLQERIADFKQNFDSLGNAFLKAGEKLKNFGLIPDPALGENLARAKQAYDHLVADCLALVQTLLPENANIEVTGLTELEELCCTLEKRLYAMQVPAEDWAGPLLAAAHKITLRGGEGAPELTDFREKLDSYAQTLDQRGNSEAKIALQQQLRAGTHPLNALFRLLAGNLSFREAAGEFNAVAAEFGMPLAVAAVQGSLALPTGNEQNPIPNPDVTAGADSGSLSSGDPESLSGALTQQSPRYAAEGDSSPPSLPKLIFELIRSGRLGPAYWLACYNEQIAGSTPVPSWLIRALETAGLLQGKGGKAAESLTYLYKQYDFIALSKKGASPSLPAALLVFAALLRPAFLAPETGAAALLGKVENLPGSLLNLATALARENTAEKPAEEEELQNLIYDVQSWLNQNKKLFLASPLASRLWEKILAEGGLVRRLFYPLLAGGGGAAENGAVEDARQLCVHLQEKGNLAKELGMLYKKVAGPAENVEIFHLPGSWQIFNRLQTALKFSERYFQLSLKINQFDKAEETVSLENLLIFWEPAKKELQGMTRQGQTDPLLSAGLAAARRALASFEKLIQDEDNSRVLTPAEVSALELKDNPHLILKPSWQPPKKTVERLGKALLELLDEQHYFPKMDGGGNSPMRESPVAYSIKNRGTAVFPADLGDLYNSGSLTLQEREFIQDIFKNICG